MFRVRVVHHWNAGEQLVPVGLQKIQGLSARCDQHVESTAGVLAFQEIQYRLPEFRIGESGPVDELVVVVDPGHALPQDSLEQRVYDQRHRVFSPLRVQREHAALFSLRGHVEARQEQQASGECGDRAPTA